MKRLKPGSGTPVFDLEEFLPYLLNQAAEATSRSFQSIYSEKFGMTRTQWRVLANLGKFGSMTAKDICEISHIEKTKVSRAIGALEEAEFLQRNTSEVDRRSEVLSLTRRGTQVFDDLGKSAIEYDQQLRAWLGQESAGLLQAMLRNLAHHSSGNEQQGQKPTQPRTAE